MEYELLMGQQSWYSNFLFMFTKNNIQNDKCTIAWYRDEHQASDMVKKKTFKHGDVIKFCSQSKCHFYSDFYKC